MHFINPFRGLRPHEEKASSVSIPSTDHLSEEIKIKLKQGKTMNLLTEWIPVHSGKVVKSGKKYIIIGQLRHPISN